MSARNISNTDDIIDSRDVIERIAELESERNGLVTDLDDARQAWEKTGCEDASLQEAYKAAQFTLFAFDGSEAAEELKTLKALAEEGRDYCPDWEYGETLIRDSYFKTYAQELADDIGAIDRNATWPLTCIDWEQAARELQMDYTALDFGGVRYWAR